MEQLVRRAAAILLGAVPTAALAAADGGYFPSSWGWPALSFLLLAGGVLALADRVEIAYRELAFAALLVALAAWSALSAVWSPGTQDQVLDAQRVLVYGAAALAMLLAVAREETPALLGGVLAAATGVCVWALAHMPGAEAESQQLAEPIGYWNGLAILAAIGILLALGLALTTRAPLGRLAAAACLGVLVPALYLTYSRGGWIALGAGLLATAALRAPRRGRIAFAAAAGVLVVAFLALGGLDRATAAFQSPLATTEGDGLERRLTSLSGHGRSDYWRVAWRQVEDEPLLGAGAGSFARYWAQYRPTEFYARDAHNLYLETLAELGPIGLALLLAAFALPLAAALRGPPLAAHAGGALAAFLAHALLDWDWELPAVTLPALACAVAALRLGPPGRPAPPALRRGLIAAALPLAAFAFVAQVGNSRISRSEEALDAGRLAEAASYARDAEAWAPWSAEPARILGIVEGGDHLRHAVEKEPARWDLWWLLAEEGGPDADRARSHVSHLNPGYP